jgi:MoaA/NifB/PqqE/SkfB family radical SAM enzyme
LGRDDLIRVADALIAAEPQGIVLAGGEPLTVPGVLDLVDRMRRAGITTTVYTGGWSVTRATVQRLAEAGARVTVSIDGATSEIHDRIRGRSGSFERALRTVELLDSVAHDDASFRFGIDYTVVRSNFEQVAQFCTDIAIRFPRLSSISFGAAVPSGLASEPEFVDRELLTDNQVRQLTAPHNRHLLQSLVTGSVAVDTTDNRLLQLHPDRVDAGQFFRTLQVEPDGEVRAMSMYEGTVGNVLTDPVDLLWERAVARWSDPAVTTALADARTMPDWARATRHIDQHFGMDAVRDRIERRTPLGSPAPGRGRSRLGRKEVV